MVRSPHKKLFAAVVLWTLAFTAVDGVVAALDGGYLRHSQQALITVLWKICEPLAIDFIALAPALINGGAWVNGLGGWLEFTSRSAGLTLLGIAGGASLLGLLLWVDLIRGSHNVKRWDVALSILPLWGILYALFLRLQALDGFEAPLAILLLLPLIYLGWGRDLAGGMVRLMPYLALPLLVLGVGGAMQALQEPEEEARAQAQDGAPSILMISVDTLRADHLGIYGYDRDTSPRIDALARSGVRFKTVLSPTSWTLPSHLSMMTGLPPEIHGVNSHDHRLADEIPTLAEAFYGEGYQTAAFVSGPYLGTEFGFSRGFEHYDDYSLVRPVPALFKRIITSPTLVEKTLNWVDRASVGPDGRPFFIFLHMWDVHGDYQPPPPYDTRFVNDGPPRLAAKVYENPTRPRAMPDERIEYLISQYDGEIAFTDHHIGRLLDALGERGLLENTIVLLTADHGEEFFEHGRLGHMNGLYEESIRVPLILSYPGHIPAGAEVGRPVSLTEIGSTLMALAGIEAPVGFGQYGTWQARDLSRIWRDPEGETERLGGPRSFYGALLRRRFSVRHRGWKFIRGLGPEELFNLNRDPHETRNLARERRQVAQKMAARLDAHRLEAEDLMKVAPKLDLDPTLEAQLEALGYTN